MSRAKSILSMGLSRALGLVIQFFAYGIYFRVLGRAGLGVVTLLATYQKFFYLLDLSLPESTSRQLTAAWANDDTERVKRVWATHRAVIYGASVLILAACTLAGQFAGFTEYKPTGNEIKILFLVAGIAFALDYARTTYSHWFQARREFQVIALANTVASMIGSLLSIAFVIYLRKPVGFFIGLGIGGLLALIILRLRQKQFDFAFGGPKVDKEIFKDATGFGVKSVGNKVAAAIGNSADRIAIQRNLGEGPLALYGTSARPGEAAFEALPFYQVISPELVAAKENGQEAFTHAIGEMMRLAAMMGICAIVVPCAFGFGLLPYIANESFINEMPVIMFLIGIYRMLELFYSAIAVMVYAGGKPEKVMPFFLWNSLVTLFASWPVVKYFGIVGIAVMNVLIMGLQFFPLVQMTLKNFAIGIDRRAVFRDILSMIAVGLVFSAIGGALSYGLYQRGIAWVSLLIAPIVCAGCFACILKLKLAKTPGFLKKLQNSRNPADNS